MHQFRHPLSAHVEELTPLQDGVPIASLKLEIILKKIVTRTSEMIPFNRKETLKGILRMVATDVNIKGRRLH